MSDKLFDLLLDTGRSFRHRLIAGAIANLRHYEEKPAGELYLNVGHTGLNSPGFREWAEKSNLKPIYFIHDLIPITHPQFCRAGEAERHRERMHVALETGAGVIANSKVTLSELRSFADAEKLAVPSTISAWLGTDLTEPSASGRRDPSTFVVVGTIEARKNHIMLLNIWSRLVDQLGSGTPRLLIIGQRGWEAEPVFHILDHDRKLQGHVLELNHCSDEELQRHLASAGALLFPSYIEGYGLPLVEALAAGVPVIASDLPAFRELCSDVPLFLDPRDEMAWETAVIDYSRTSSPSRAAQMKRIEGFAAPTWAEHFSAVEKWLARFA